MLRRVAANTRRKSKRGKRKEKSRIEKLFHPEWISLRKRVVAQCDEDAENSASRRLRGVVHRTIVPRVPMIPSGSFTADDSSSSIVTGASCIRACRAVTTISRQLGSSASARATHAPENGSKSPFGAHQQQQQQRDNSTESLFWIRDGERGARAARRARDWRWRQAVPEAVGVGGQRRRDKGGDGGGGEEKGAGERTQKSGGGDGRAKDEQSGGERKRRAEIESGRKGSRGRRGSSIGGRAPQMRGPQGRAVRGGVTRCGRPPPLCRGRGRGKTSRLPIPSSSPTTGDRQLNMSADSSVLRFDSPPLFHRVECDAMFFTEDEMILQRIIRFPEGRGFIGAGSGRDERETEATTRDEIRRARRISRVRRFLKIVPRSTVPSPKESFCWYSSAPSVAWRAPRPWPARKSTAPGQSRRDTASCAASRPDRRRPSRPTMGCHTRRRRSARCVTCLRSPRRRGEVPKSPTPCRRPARSIRRRRTRNCRGRDAPISRGWNPYWRTRAKTACIWTSTCPNLLTVSLRCILWISDL